MIRRLRVSRSAGRPATLVLALGACTGNAGERRPPDPPGTLVFGVVGDAPYNVLEERRFAGVIEDVNRDSLPWVIHVGDAFSAPCTDVIMEDRVARLRMIDAGVVFTPGDNDWTDCWGRRMGRYDPLERLDAVRRIFFPRPGWSLGGRPIAVVSQSDDPRWREFVENQRWTGDRVTFATVHLVGSRNGLERHPGWGAPNEREAARRTEASVAWLRDAFEQARADSARAVVVAMHAEPNLDAPADDPYRAVYRPFFAALATEARAYGGPVLLIHGDSHAYRVDRPLVDSMAGDPVPNVTRLITMGSPDLGWVRVTLDADGRFSFEPRRVSFWRVW